MLKTFKGTFASISIICCSILMLSSSNEVIKTLSVGDKMPGKEFKLINLENESRTLADYKKSKGTLVIFSCNTCPFVIGSSNFAGWEKDYNAIADRANACEVGSVLVNSNEAKRDVGDNLKDMIIRADNKGYDMSYVLDEKHKLADEFGAKTTPHVFLFDAQDILVYEGQIDNSYDPKAQKVIPYLELALKSLENGTKIKIQKTDAVGCSIKRTK